MRTFARRLFTLTAAGSMLLTIAAVILWLRSDHLTDSVTSRHAQGQTSLHTRRGHLVLNLFRANWSNQPAESFGVRYDRDLPAPPQQDLMVRLMLCSNPGTIETYWERGGFAWWYYRRRDGVLNILAVAPFWSLTTASAAPPLAWIALRLRSRVRREDRHLARQCPACGYDIRATPDRCPECGELCDAKAGK